MKNTLGWLFISLFMVGCTFDAGDAVEEADDESLGSAEDAVRAPNAINPNAINPNAINPNAISPSALVASELAPASIPSSAMTALQGSGEAGDLSRSLVKYLVSCAFTTSQSFSFSWTDSLSAVHNETYTGMVGLAPDWATRGLTLSEQQWVSACIAVRANYYGTSVIISMRGTHTALSMDMSESIHFPMQEGAFWGNIFGETVSLKSCYDPANVVDARDQRRECAYGHYENGITTDCANIDSIGECATYCTDRTNPANVSDDGFASCNGTSEVIAAYLQD